MAVVNTNTFDLRLSINKCAKLIAVNGDEKTYIVEGPMGSGKSTITKLLEETFGDKYNYVNVDCTQWDVGDIQIPDVDKEMLVTRFVPNVLLMGDGKKPMIINLDEIGKASRPVQNAFLPVMLERRVGARSLPEGSIVFGCTNLGQEGVGDLFQPHARNRVSFLEMRMPTAEEWLQNWGLVKGLHPAVLAWVKENGDGPKGLFATFKDVENPEDNPYIFHPKAQRRSFVTPRSLHLAALELDDDRRNLVGDDDATFAAIAGNIGTQAAADLMAFVHLADKTPSWNSIINSPDSANVPDDNAGAMIMTVFKCISKVDKNTLNSVMAYIKRLPKEMQGVFANRIMAVKTKATMVAMNMEFTKWVRENHWMMNA